MKKLYAVILSICLILPLAPRTVHAAKLPVCETSEIVWQDDDFSIVMMLTMYDSDFAERATTTKTASKRYDIVDKNSIVRATYMLSGTFTYTGTSSTCTFADCTASTDGTWSFLYKEAHKQGNQAVGSFNAEHNNSIQTISKTLTITCSATGQIS